MKRFTLLKTMLLLCALIVGSSSLWAADTLVETIDFTSANTSRPSISSYGTNSTWGNWAIVGAANNSKSWSYLRIGGGKNNSSPSTITRTTAGVSQAIDYIEINHEGRSSSNYSITSIVAEASSSTNFTSPTATKTVSNPSITSAGTIKIEFDSQVAANSYFKITINWSNSSTSNAGLNTTNVKFYQNASTDPALSVDPSTAETFTYEYGEGPSSDQMFEVTLSNSTKPITAAITGDYEMTDDESYGTSNLTLSSGDIVSVRLRAGLSIGNHDGTLTFSSDGATNVVVNLAGTVTKTPPSISADNVEISYNANAGSIAYTVAHKVAGGVLTASKTSGDWLTVGTVGESSVAFTCSANSGDEREAVVRLTYTYTDGTEQTTTKDVTITQTSALLEQWVATDLADLSSTDVFVIVGTNGNGSYAMSNDNGTETPPTATAVTISTGKITSSVANNLKWNIGGNSTDGYTFYPNGSTTTWLYCTNTNNGVRVGTNDSKTFKVADDYLKHDGTSRFVGVYTASGQTVAQDWRCYTSINANIKEQTFTFYKKQIVTSVTVGANGYTTFASTSALDLTDANRPAGLKAYKATRTGATLTFTALDQTVPAGTGLLLLGETKGGSYNIPVVASGDAVSGNALVGVTTATAKQSIADDTYYFVMKKAANAESALEFLPLSTSAAVTIPAGKAYVEVPNSAFAGAAHELSFTFSDNETTGIKAIDNSQLINRNYFNLAGQRVAQPTKGLYIVNGKKVVIK